MAFGTSTPTSITVVATSTSSSPALNARIIVALLVRRRMRPCTRPTRTSGSAAAQLVAARLRRRCERRASSDSSISGHTQYAWRPARAARARCARRRSARRAVGQHDGLRPACGRAAARRSPRRRDRRTRSSRACAGSASRSSQLVRRARRRVRPCRAASARCCTPNRCCSSMITSAEPRERDAFLRTARACRSTTSQLAGREQRRARCARARAASTRSAARRDGRARSSQRAKLAACCSASSSVGAITAVCLPAPRPRSAASAATTVLPEPTSPCSSRCIGCGSARSARISANARCCARGERERQRGPKTRELLARLGNGHERSLRIASAEALSDNRCATSSSTAIRRCAGWWPVASSAVAASCGGRCNSSSATDSSTRRSRHGAPPPALSVARAAPLGEQIAEIVDERLTLEHRQRPADQPAQQCLVQPLGARIDRRERRFGRGLGGAQRTRLGMDHLEARRARTHFAVATHARAADERVLLRAREVEEAQRERSGAVCDAAEQRAAAPDSDFGELDRALDQRFLARHESADRRDRGPVLVALRQQAEQVADRAHAELREALGHLRPDAREAVDRTLERGFRLSRDNRSTRRSSEDEHGVDFDARAARQRRDADRGARGIRLAEVLRHDLVDEREVLAGP